MHRYIKIIFVSLLNNYMANLLLPLVVTRQRLLPLSPVMKGCCHRQWGAI